MDENIVNFKYKFSEVYNPVYINGAYGGIGPRGELEVNFYLERQPIPYTEVHPIDKDGKLGARVAIKPEDHTDTIIRFVTTGIVMNLETAKTIHQWLGNNIKKLESAKEGK